MPSYTAVIQTSDPDNLTDYLGDVADHPIDAMKLLGQKIFTCLKSIFAKTIVFVQAEYSNQGGFHWHFIIDSEFPMTFKNFNRIAEHIKQFIPLQDLKVEPKTGWNKNRNQVIQMVDPKSFICNYFLKKSVYPSKSDDYCIMTWYYSEEQLFPFEEFPQDEETRQSFAGYESDEEPSAKKTKKNSNADRFIDTIGWLVNKGVCTEKDWITHDRIGYLSLQASSQGTGQIKRALQCACREMILTKTLGDYLSLNGYFCNIETNRICKILTLNRYNPFIMSVIFYQWATKQNGKRNTIWLYGTATTGKTNIAQAISKVCPMFGSVNHNNDNFPFNDCIDKMLIWWEEGKIKECIVEAAKAILGGSEYRIDVKCKDSQPITQTPVIITSNHDMTVVIGGNYQTEIHKEPLEDRMIKIILNEKLPIDFGLISEQEVRDFFHMGKVLHEKNHIKAEFNMLHNNVKLYKNGQYCIDDDAFNNVMIV